MKIIYLFATKLFATIAKSGIFRPNLRLQKFFVAFDVELQPLFSAIKSVFGYRVRSRGRYSFRYLVGETRGMRGEIEGCLLPLRPPFYILPSLLYFKWTVLFCHQKNLKSIL